ncbi:MAG: HIT family protein [Bacteroidales bacterium]|nr:MAG: HIT family protein [Bacteroidales bacterium]
MAEVENNIDCPFCRSGIKDLSFFENEDFSAIYNVAPILPGHALVIPKKHITSFLDLPDKDLFEFIKFSRTVIKILSKAFNTEAFNWTLQEKDEAGQSIAHMHIHIIPRKPEDLPHPGDWYPKLKYNINNILDSHKREKLKPEQLKVIVEKLQDISAGIIK